MGLENDFYKECAVIVGRMLILGGVLLALGITGAVLLTVGASFASPLFIISIIGSVAALSGGLLLRRYGNK